VTLDSTFGEYLERPPPKAEPAEPPRAAATKPPAVRSLRLTAASAIAIQPVRWLWEGRIALGSLALLGGREGIGKSTAAYTLIADVTRGRLIGAHLGQPRAVLVAATEDSWAYTIVPRLLAADADLDLVYRVEVDTSEGVETGLSLPRDLHALEASVREVQAALILLDPLMSRLDSTLDTHKDSEVRLALEPVVSIADRTGAAVLGLIHVNKSNSGDPLSLLMGSRAFAAVARAVLFVMLDPDDESVRLLGQPKNNLGSIDLPTMTFRIESHQVAETEKGPIITGRLRWLDERAGSIRDAIEAASETLEARSATSEAADWLRDHLTSQGGTDDSASIKTAGGKAGHSLSALKRARQRIRVTSEAKGFPRRTFWSLSESLIGFIPGESGLTELTEPTGPTGGSVSPIGSVGPVGTPPTRGCADCGQQLLLDRPGRERCARCERAA
jgi:hypothetical protein